MSWSSVPCAEEAWSAKESFDDTTGVMSAEVTLRCDWLDRHDLVSDICGNRMAWPHGAPALVPRAAGASIALPNQAYDLVDDQQILYRDALVTIHFTTRLEELVTESLEPTSEFITLDHRYFRWGSNAGDLLQEQEAPGYLMKGLQLVRSETDVSDTEIGSYITDLVGCVNQDAYTSSWLGGLTFAPETLLFVPPVLNRKTTSLNSVKYDLTKKFSYKPQGWNTWLRSKTGLWTAIYIAGGAQLKPYVPASFAGVLV
jgi:hypothetical protein